MDLLLAGTAPSAGFPVSGCACANCALSGTPGLPARRPAELWFGPSSESGWRLDVTGVIHDPHGRPHRLRPGTALERPGFSIAAIGSGDDPSRTGLLVRTDRTALLWAPQAGRLTSAQLGDLSGLTLAAVFLGPGPEPDPTHPDDEQPPLVECAFGLARLRATGAVTARTRCLLVGVGHRQGRPDRLARCLAHWGAQTPPDGSRMTIGADGENQDGDNGENQDAGPVGGRTLVLGGSASGKSALAEQLLAAEPEVLYTATGPVVDLRSNPDLEWAQRVSRHRERRPAWWRTEETHEVATLLATAPQPVLLDSLGTWLTGLLDRCGAWSEQPGWRDQLARETDELVGAWRTRRTALVAVSDETGWGIVPVTASGRLFRDELGRLNRRLAAESERVLLVVAGQLVPTDSAGSPR